MGDHTWIHFPTTNNCAGLHWLPAPEMAVEFVHVVHIRGRHHHLVPEETHTLLSSSTSKADKEALPPLTKFPTTNSNEPNLVLANRKRTRERYMAGKRYQLFSEGTKKTIRIEM